MSDLLSLVGHTPLVELKACSPKPGVRLFAKLEGQNPTGSIKDRIVAFMLERARAEGRLRPGQELVEATTGNTGISLAMAGGRLGHPVRAVVPESVFPDLVQALKAYGAEVEWVPPNLGIKSAIDVAADIARRDDAFLLDQFASANNPLCHYETTGRRDPRAVPRRRLPGRRAGHRRHDHGRRPASEGAQPCGAADRRRAPHRQPPPGPAQHGRRLRAADPRC